MLVAAFVPLLGIPKKPEFHAISPSGKAAPPKGSVKYGGEHFAILKQSQTGPAIGEAASVEGRCNKSTVKFSSADMDINTLHGIIHNNLGGVGPNFGEERLLPAGGGS